MSGEKQPLKKEKSKEQSSEDLEPWKETIFGCFNNIQNCLLGAIPGGSCVMQGVVVNKVNDQPVWKHCLIACGGCCFGCAYNRQIIRQELKLQGDYWPDVALHCFCNCCAACQEYREQALRAEENEV